MSATGPAPPPTSFVGPVFPHLSTGVRGKEHGMGNGNEMPARGFRGESAGDGNVTVALVCLFCARVQTIRVPRSMAAGGTIHWQCFPCQQKDRSELLGKEGAAGKRPTNVEGGGRAGGPTS